MKIGEGETFWRRGEHPHVSPPSPKLPARLASAPSSSKTFVFIEFPLSCFSYGLQAGPSDWRMGRTSVPVMEKARIIDAGLVFSSCSPETCASETGGRTPTVLG